MELIKEGDYKSSLEYFGGIFNELADYFVDSHFVNIKEIKWKEIYELININHISDKFEQMLGNNRHFVNDENSTNINDDEDEDNNEYDSRDEVDEPITITKCQYSTFNFELDSNEQRCLNEYYKIQKVIIYEVTSESKDILSEVKSPSGHILIHYKN